MTRERKHPPPPRRCWRLVLVALATLALLAAGSLLRLRQVKRSQLPEAVWRCLRHPQRVTVYSLHPRAADFEALMLGKTAPEKSNPTIFRDYQIVGQTELAEASDRVRAAAAVEDSAASVFAVPALCFDPLHGVRVSDEESAFDFVICYGCGYLLCYEADWKVAYIDAGGSPKTLHGFLLAAHVSVEKTPGEN